MARGMLHRLIDTFMEAAKDMGMSCECSDVERLAVLIHRVMSYQSRQFHTLEHVFGFLDGGADGETILAAAFHDLVYYQVDDGLPPELVALLGPYFSVESGRIRLAEKAARSDRAYADCLAIFGFEPGREIQPYGGLNEFLSALTMASSLGPHLPRPRIAAICACIEATIPFRAASPGGAGIGEALEARLLRLAREEGLSMTGDEVEASVRRAIGFANADVRDFALRDPGLFLSNTWKLLPESNPSLRQKGAFTVKEYRVSLVKMLGFFRSLKPASVYHSYRGEPDAAAMAALVEGTRRNLELAEAYMRAKLLAVSLIEATAAVSGGDAPMALFMGDLPQGSLDAVSLDQFLPPAATPPWIQSEHPVYRLLKDGRLDESSFDLKNSPLALYLYNRLAPATWGERSRAADSFFSGEIDADTFLKGFDRAFLADFLAACASMVPTRKAALEAWAARQA